MVRFFIRADSAERIGIGHIMRCLALCEVLEHRAKEIVFLCAEISEPLSSLIVLRGYKVLRLFSPYEIGSLEDAEYTIQHLFQEFGSAPLQEDYLIIDHYGIDAVWESVMMRYLARVLVIDDLANRPHNCHLLLDSNHYDDMETRYNKLVSANTIQLLGPGYALLRQEFGHERNRLNIRSPKTHTNILVCFGGTDPTNETLKVVKALSGTTQSNKKPMYHLTVILGASNPNIGIISEVCKDLDGIQVLVQPRSMAEEMRKADLAICSAGTITWERYCMGLPALLIAIADNQVAVAQQAESMGLDRYLGESKNVIDADIMNALSAYMNEDHDFINRSKERVMNLVDGKGAERVVKALLATERP